MFWLMRRVLEKNHYEKRVTGGMCPIPKGNSDQRALMFIESMEGGRPSINNKV